MIQTTIVGNVGRDAETKTISSGGRVTEWTVAVNRRFKGEDQTAWFRCSLWGRRGENLAQHITRGKKVTVVGSLWPREYTGSDGGTRTSLDVEVSDVEFMGRRDDEQAQAYQATPAYQPTPTVALESASVYDDEIPF